MISPALHEIIEANATEIVDRFVSEVREHELSPPLTRAAIIDHLNIYLAEMVSALRRGDVTALSGCETAREHGEQRWYVGYDLRSVILEYGVLRKVILEVFKSTGASLNIEELDAFSQFLNLGIAAAAAEFVEHSNRKINEALEQARRATQAREEVVAIVSHDLKNPLNVIYGSVHVLRRELTSEDLNARRQRLQKRLESVGRAADRMNELINRMLELARIEAGELHLQLEETSSVALLAETSEQLSTLAEERSVRLVVAEAEDGALCCDRERILQVLQNLVGNAIKFSPVGGTVTLRARWTKAGCTFEVTDTGPGISQERLPYIFNRYWQAPETAAQGTGLGLSIAKGIVELHGGNIWVESEGTGSTFAFRLPKIVGR